MAIQDFDNETGSGWPAADPRRTRRAPFPARAEHSGDPESLTEQARDGGMSERLLASDRRTVARCPACGKAVLAGDDYVRDRGDLYHTRCARQRGEERRPEPVTSPPPSR